jgi:hypothetical protein
MYLDPKGARWCYACWLLARFTRALLELYSRFPHALLAGAARQPQAPRPLFALAVLALLVHTSESIMLLVHTAVLALLVHTTLLVHAAVLDARALLAAC